jgi:hypothetical protein
MLTLSLSVNQLGVRPDIFALEMRVAVICADSEQHAVSLYDPGICDTAGMHAWGRLGSDARKDHPA